jgi:phage gp29-like protein
MSQEDVRKALQAAQAARADGAVAIPNSLELELLEALKGTVDQATFHRQMGAEVSKIVLGQTMTTDDGASLAQGKVHFDVREELTDADIEDLCESFQTGPATWLTQWNFPGAATPILKRPGVEDQVRAAELATQRSTALKTMTDAGYEPEEETLASLFPGWRRRAAPAPTTTPIGKPFTSSVPVQPTFAEPSTAPADAIDDFAESLDWEPAVLPMVDAIRQHILASPSLDHAVANLDAVFEEGADKAAQALFTSATFQARLAGLFGVPLSDAEAKVLNGGQ